MLQIPATAFKQISTAKLPKPGHLAHEIHHRGAETVTGLVRTRLSVNRGPIDGITRAVPKLTAYFNVLTIDGKTYRDGEAVAEFLPAGNTLALVARGQQHRVREASLLGHKGAFVSACHWQGLPLDAFEEIEAITAALAAAVLTDSRAAKVLMRQARERARRAERQLREIHAEIDSLAPFLGAETSPMMPGPGS